MQSQDVVWQLVEIQEVMTSRWLVSCGCGDEMILAVYLDSVSLHNIRDFNLHSCCCWCWWEYGTSPQNWPNSVELGDMMRVSWSTMVCNKECSLGTANPRAWTATGWHISSQRSPSPTTTLSTAPIPLLSPQTSPGDLDQSRARKHPNQLTPIIEVQTLKESAIVKVFVIMGPSKLVCTSFL